MRQIVLLLISVILLTACDDTNKIRNLTVAPAVVPIPKDAVVSEKVVVLSGKSTIYSENEKVLPLLTLFKTELKKLTGFELEITNSRQRAAITFATDGQLADDEYHIEIDDQVRVSGGSYQALAMARATLLQMSFTQNNELYFPVATIKDRPSAKYRGLLIDLARSWHSVATIKKLIDLASFYKSNYVQLHFTDYQSYTLPSDKYPNLSTPDRHYTFEELDELEAYAQLRGITIIPEIDIPGHSSSIVNAYPEIFALKDKKENPWIINMGKEEVYAALEDIIAEVARVFKATPYFHIGGDEAIFNKTMDDPDVQAYMEAHQLGDDVHELYRHFLVRMNEIVKRQGKQMCVWEGFRREGEIPIPKDIIVYEFETNRYLPNHLVADGYTVVNTSWKPLYVVNKKKWEPKTIYGWNMWRWENWFPKAPSFTPIQVEESPLVIGAQMCAWEQADEVEFPSLRKRLPALNERIWNTEQVAPYDEFINKLEQVDAKLSLITDDTEQDSLLFDYNFEKED
ncbi:family 20 glycosylhydrolase [Fulvivirgaceae bacterium BMA12]|uniref:beta-N-acetylhexosaminidase n=1 Tax=Agaribacillus aureus TaxID=3051825 RepID=A0ABT8L244_9BACT|nr:family 20 glycosylhydrolase [Fulvivirgaceae bacterium BMA12]